MKAFVEQLFLQSDFTRLSEDGEEILFSNGGKGDKKSYWLIAERVQANILEEQITLFQKFKSLVQQPDFDKNCSLLVLINTSDIIIDQDFKRKSLLIEDNPYYFKKYVLCYTTNEFDQFTVSRNNRSELAFLEREMVSRACFDIYKRDPKAENWQSFIFRLALKIPFIDVKVSTKPGLSALFDDNEGQLSAKGFETFDEILRSYVFEKSADEIGKIPPLEILEALNLNKLQNGDQNSSGENTEL